MAGVLKTIVLQITPNFLNNQNLKIYLIQKVVAEKKLNSYYI